MARNNNGRMARWLAAVRRSLSEESGAIAAGLFTSLGVDAMPDGFVEYLSSQISPALLGNNRLQRLVARTASAMFGLGDAGQEIAEATIMDFLETLAERSKNLTDNEEEEEMADDKKKADDKKASKDAKPAAKEAPPPKPPKKTLLQMVGDLTSDADRKKFWDAVAMIIATFDEVNVSMSTDADDLKKPTPRTDKFLARVKHVTMADTELKALLDMENSFLRAQMLEQAVKHASHADNVSGGFKALVESATERMSNMIAGPDEPSNLAKELAVTNRAMRIKRSQRNGIR